MGACGWGKNLPSGGHYLFMGQVSFVFNCVMPFLLACKLSYLTTRPSLNPTPLFFLFPFIHCSLLFSHCSLLLLSSWFSFFSPLFPSCLSFSISCFFGVGVVQFNRVPPIVWPTDNRFKWLMLSLVGSLTWRSFDWPTDQFFAVH